MKSFLARFVLPTTFATVLAASALAQADAPKPGSDNPERDRPERRRFDPEEMRTRMMSAMRDQFKVEDDAEWSIISDRINKVMELRRASGSGFGGFIGFGRSRNAGPGGSEGRSRFGGTQSPEAEALSAAIKDEATDAELKARLDRLREVRKDNEARLAQAQEDLRSVLNIRQEAVAVLDGLLP